MKDVQLRIRDLLVPSGEPVSDEPAPVVRRRRVVVAATLALGAAILGGTLGSAPGSRGFYLFGGLLAATWLVGSVASGPVSLGRRGGVSTAGREIVYPIVLGFLAYVLFVGAGLVVKRIPVLEGALDDILVRADTGPAMAVLAIALFNGLAEEVFFRGALHTALGENRPALYSTLAYVAVTVATLNPALVLAAAVMGTIFALERMATHGVLAPILTHLTWSSLMFLAFPR